MKKILVYGMTDNKGGIEAVIMNYYRLFDHNEIIFDFVTDYDSMAYSEEVMSMGSCIKYIPSRRQNIIKHILAIRRIVKNGSYQAVYFNLLSASGVFSMLGLVGFKNLPIIVHSHNNAVKRMWLHRLCKPVLNILATHRWACSTEAGVFMFGESNVRKGNVKVIKNAIDCKYFQFNKVRRQQMRNALGIGDKTFVVGHVGRMCYQKNTLFLIDLFLEINKREPNSVLLLVGEGEDRPIVEKKIHTYGLDSCVLLLGMRNDVSDLMQAMDVFLLPSRFEGFPVVVVEAQASGLPCVLADTITHEVGLTNSVKFVSLNSTISEWANTVFLCRQGVRESLTHHLFKAGYSIQEQSKELQTILLNLNDRGKV